MDALHQTVIRDRYSRPDGRDQLFLADHPTIRRDKVTQYLEGLSAQGDRSSCRVQDQPGFEIDRDLSDPKRPLALSGHCATTEPKAVRIAHFGYESSNFVPVSGLGTRLG
ncbi:hypothetical protein ACEUZ9_000503 [Paracoccus litorisediminis]|jgi:hypothetical protein|uniref:hypothetical protein n=1 Tax=Paracoccus litorisediminis TaxID=2006130 RepID=UPI001FE297FC|nr:hypothetical protein [Paracoccus litorisediminis]